MQFFIERSKLNKVWVRKMAIAASHVLERRMVMSGFSPADFGRAFEKIQMEYQTGIGAYLAPFST